MQAKIFLDFGEPFFLTFLEEIFRIVGSRLAQNVDVAFVARRFRGNGVGLSFRFRFRNERRRFAACASVLSRQNVAVDAFFGEEFAKIVSSIEVPRKLVVDRLEG